MENTPQEQLPIVIPDEFQVKNTFDATKVTYTLFSLSAYKEHSMKQG
jgi:hypothetical protein